MQSVITKKWLSNLLTGPVTFTVLQDIVIFADGHVFKSSQSIPFLAFTKCPEPSLWPERTNIFCTSPNGFIFSVCPSANSNQPSLLFFCTTILSYYCQIAL